MRYGRTRGDVIICVLIVVQVVGKFVVEDPNTIINDNIGITCRFPICSAAFDKFITM
jgi:hypothetical protein